MDAIPLSKLLLMDGATGTELMRRGMPAGVCTEQWILEHPQQLVSLQKEYVSAGSRVLLAPTFGANRLNLDRYDAGDRVEEYNRRLVELSRQAAEGRALVAGDMTTLGLALAPTGESGFEEMVALYTQQAAALEHAGVDLFVVETMLRMSEARAAVLAIKSVSRKPIWVLFTCDEAGRTSAGTDVLAAMIVMQGMGVDAFGLNCCGAETAVEQLERLAPYAAVPLVAKPCGALPGERTCTPEELCAHVPGLTATGVRMLGGCCGTGPEHIAALSGVLEQVDLSVLPERMNDPDVIPCASGTEARFITPDVDVGETIACTPDLLEDILRAEEAPQGALKIAVLEEDDLDIFAENQYAIQDALCIYSDVPEYLEKALRLYQGRAFWDGTEELEEAFLAEMSRKYGLVIL